MVGNVCFSTIKREGCGMIEKLYGNIPSYGKSYFTEKYDETGSSMVKNLFKRIILSK